MTGGTAALATIPQVLTEVRSADAANVGRLWALLALGDFELHLLVLLEVPVTLAGDGAEVHEHVRTTFILSDEPEALLGTEPLDGACTHEQSPPFSPLPGLIAARWASARRP